MADPAAARVLLIGHGPLPGPGCRHSTFGPQRTLAFAHTLRSTGIALRVVLLDPAATRAAPLPHAPWAGTWSLAMADARRVRLWADEPPTVVISAGPYAPAHVAALHRGDAPWIADVPGDPLAELAAATDSGPVAAAEVEAARATALRTLAEADVLLAISEPQRFACLGQLGLLGRVAAGGPPVEVCPISVPALDDAGGLLPAAAPRHRRPTEALRVLCGGALNGWQALDAALAGVERALDAGAPIELHLTGGAGGATAPGQEATLAAFCRRRAADARVVTHGWLDEQALHALEARCHIGLSIDGPGLEPELGSRTRLLRWSWAGLGLLGTARCALAQQLVQAGGMIAVQPTAEAVGDALLRCADGRLQVHPTVAPAQALLRAIAHPDVALAPLRAAALHPTRATRATLPWLELPAALQAVQAELDAVYASPTWRITNRIHRAWRAAVR